MKLLCIQVRCAFSTSTFMLLAVEMFKLNQQTWKCFSLLAFDFRWYFQWTFLFPRRWKNINQEVVKTQQQEQFHRRYVSVGKYWCLTLNSFTRYKRNFSFLPRTRRSSLIAWNCMRPVSRHPNFPCNCETRGFPYWNILTRFFRSECSKQSFAKQRK